MNQNLLNFVHSCLHHLSALVYSPDYQLELFHKHILIALMITKFPLAASLKDARVGFNFGYKPFSFPPKHSSRSGHPWTPVALVEDSRRVGNWNVGWRVNPGDVSSSTNLVVSPNGRMVQAVENTGWQGFRANKVRLTK